MTLRWLALAAPLALLAPLLGSCTAHGEGGRCDKQLNGDNDCASGLVCTQGDQLLLPGDSGTHSGTDICCPSDRTTAAPGSICALAPPTPGSDASIPDSGTDGAISDATTDQASGDAADGSDGAIDDGSTDAPDGD